MANIMLLLLLRMGDVFPKRRLGRGEGLGGGGGEAETAIPDKSVVN